jgi:hypothetical protein
MLASIRRNCGILSEWFASVGRFAATYAADLIYFVGMLIMCYGFSAAWEPLGPIVFGGMICLPMLIQKMRGTHA